MFGRRKHGRAPQPVPATATWPVSTETAVADPLVEPESNGQQATDESTGVVHGAASSAATVASVPSPVPPEAGAEPASNGGIAEVGERAATWAATWGITEPTQTATEIVVDDASDGSASEAPTTNGIPAEMEARVLKSTGESGEAQPSANGEAAPGDLTGTVDKVVGQTDEAPAFASAAATTATAEPEGPNAPMDASPMVENDEHDGAESRVSRETSPAASEAGGSAPDNRGDASASPSLHDPDGDMTTQAELDPDEQRRAALVQSLPTVTDDTPLMAELQQDARRRIELRGRRFPRPAETRIVTVANQKGGVGKTTTTVNIAAALAQSGLNVLVLDNDPQGNASTALGVEHRAGTPSIYEVLVEGAPIAEAVQESPDVPNLWCLPATIDLSGAEIELVSMVARETRLRSALDTYLQWRIDNGLERIDYVLVDCPPSLGLLTVNAFVVAREVLIPIQCEYYALEGLSQLLKTIQLIQAHLNRDLHVSTILLTMYDARTNLAQQVASEVREHFPERTLRTTVPRSVRISEAPSYGQTVMTYDAGSSGALAYLEAAREIAERGAATTDVTPSNSATAESGAEEDR